MDRDTPVELVFATTPASGGDERELILLARSIRAFGGELAGSRLWVFVPDQLPLTSRTKTALTAAGVQLHPYSAPGTALAFPFAAKVYAAGAAEALARAEGADLLVWMDPDTILIQPPEEFLLGADRQLGCRPVQLTLISSPYDQPLDEFWTAVYQRCGVDQQAAFDVVTTVDRRRIRANFNAGLLVVRPAAGLLQRWAGCFASIFPDPIFEPFYQRNILYKYFIHQCALAGCILAALRREQIQDFSPWVNYPVFKHNKLPAELRADSWNRLVSARYDDYRFFWQGEWQNILPMHPTISDWLPAQIEALANAI